MGRNNTLALAPQYTHQGPLTRGLFTCQPPCHVAPLGRSRGLAWPLPRVRVRMNPRGLAQLCHVALRAVLHPRGSCAPRQLCASRVLRGSCRKLTPFFAIFIKEKSKINSRKILKNPKYSEIHIFKIITPFNLKFSPLDHNFLSF